MGVVGARWRGPTPDRGPGRLAKPAFDLPGVGVGVSSSQFYGCAWFASHRVRFSNRGLRGTRLPEFGHFFPSLEGKL